jgi:hypothetical protein
MKTCAICGGTVLTMQNDVCTKCYKQWGRDEPWIKALVKITQHDAYLTRKDRTVDLVSYSNLIDEPY